MSQSSPAPAPRERYRPAADTAEAGASRKKLLLISQYFPWEAGGAEHQVYCLAEYLRPRMDVHYLINSDRRPESAEPGIHITAIPRRRLLRRILGRCYALDYGRVLSAIRRIRPDFIYLRGATAYLGIAARYTRSSPCTLIWHIASEYSMRPFQMRSLRMVAFDYLDRKMMEYGVRHADYIFGQARYQDELLQRNYGRRCDLIVGNWHPEPVHPRVKERPVKIAWIANIKPVKRPDLFVDLAEQLGRGTDAEFIMVGRPASPRYQQPLESRIRRTKNLKYLGEKSIEEVNRILAGSHICVNTSEYEGFPNTFIQAWLCEVPVVSLHVDPDGVLRREGLGFCSGSFEQLARDTRKLIEEPALRARIGQTGRRYALEHHSLNRNLRRVAEFLGIY